MTVRTQDSGLRTQERMTLSGSVHTVVIIATTVHVHVHVLVLVLYSTCAGTYLYSPKGKAYESIVGCIMTL